MGIIDGASPSYELDGTEEVVILSLGGILASISEQSGPGLVTSRHKSRPSLFKSYAALGSIRIGCLGLLGIYL